MGSSSDGSAATSAATAESEGEAAQRGFFGRLMDALSPADTSPVKSAAPGDAMPVVQTTAAHGISNLRRLRIDDVAVPKVDIVAVAMDIGKEALVAVFREHGFSRVPVYKGTLDHPQGLILLKDLALQHGFGSTTKFSLRRMLRPVL